jgi:hypothetical protein
VLNRGNGGRTPEAEMWLIAALAGLIVKKCSYRDPFWGKGKMSILESDFDRLAQAWYSDRELINESVPLERADL